jgi:hypothetical protein
VTETAQPQNQPPLYPAVSPGPAGPAAPAVPRLTTDPPGQGLSHYDALHHDFTPWM